METLIIHPENKEQLSALKTFMKAFNISFEALEIAEKKMIIETKKFDFSLLAGKLQWDGDALKEQKKLRAEWD
jgi:hypothetical protein